MKPKYLLLISTLSIAAVAVGAVISQGATTPIENAYGEDGKLAYSMTLDYTTNALFEGGYGAGAASTATSTKQWEIDFASYVVHPGSDDMHSYGTNTFTLVASNNGVHTMFGNTKPFSSITSVKVNYSYDAYDGTSSLYIYGSNEVITSIPNDGGELLQNHQGAEMLKGKGYRYFAISASGATAHPSATYYIGISSIVINYTC